MIEAKEALSFVPVTKIELEYRGKKYQREIHRELFDKLITPISRPHARSRAASASRTPE